MSPEIFVGLSKGIKIDGLTLSNDELLRIICNELEVDIVYLKLNPKNRKREIVNAKQIYFYFKRRLTKESLSNIGKYLDKDHATVLYAVKQVNNHIEVDRGYRKLIEKLRVKIGLAMTLDQSYQSDKIINKYA